MVFDWIASVSKFSTNTDKDLGWQETKRHLSFWFCADAMLYQMRIFIRIGEW